MSELAGRTEQIPYEPPAVVYEAALEVRAGTPLGLLQPWSEPDPSQPQ